MELLASAANAVFSHDEAVPIPLTPTKDSRTAFGEITNVVNLSPEKCKNSHLQALFYAPTLNSPQTKTLVPNKFTRNTETLHHTPKDERSLSKALGSIGKSPLTPTSNLKLLTRVASMEEAMPSRKALFHPGNNITSPDIKTSPVGGKGFRRYKSDTVLPAKVKTTLPNSGFRKHATSLDCSQGSEENLEFKDIGNLQSVDDTLTSKSFEISRKDKSLGLLSEKFLDHFPLKVTYLETPRRLVIDEVAKLLGTERRRVYDIINVLESLNMACRVQKNMYSWMGNLHLEETLGRLKALALKMDFASQLRAELNSDRHFKFPQPVRVFQGGENEKADCRREKSLGILCQKFIMLFLISPEPHVISLDTAIRLLVGEPGEDGERLRTRGRRLYDIANVLTSLRIVKKAATAKSFQYIGPNVEAFYPKEDILSDVQLQFCRHSLLPSKMREAQNGFGDHDVTPSDVAPPVQKRGRPRKLSSDFPSVTVQPAPKKAKLQRAKSEDVGAKKSGRKLTRKPSLHDICQVANLEREKLLETEKSKLSPLKTPDAQPITMGIKPPQDQVESPLYLWTSERASLTRAVPPKNARQSHQSLLRHRLTTGPKVPVALTFKSPPPKRIQDTQRNMPLNESSKTDKSLKPYQVIYSDGRTISRYQSEPFEVKQQESHSEKLPKELQVRNVTSFTTELQKITSAQSMESHSESTMNQPLDLTGNTQGPHIFTKFPINIGGKNMNPSETKSLQRPIIVVKGNSFHNSAEKIKMNIPTLEQDRQKANSMLGSRSQGPQIIHGSYIPGSQLKQESHVPGSQVIKVITKTKCPLPHNSKTVITVLPADVSIPTEVTETTRQNENEKPKHVTLLMNTQKTCNWVQPSQEHHRMLPEQSHEMFTSKLTNFQTLAHQMNSKVSPYHSHGTPSASESRDYIEEHWGTTIPWQPSPDNSSTDSELEQIFGDSFKFTRPKDLTRHKS